MTARPNAGDLRFVRASMAGICAKVGYSKATLYSYFASKEELFYEVMTQATEAEFQATLEALDPAVEQSALQQFGERMLALLYSPEVQAVRRLVVSHAAHSDLGERCMSWGPPAGWWHWPPFVQDAMDEGKLKRADPQIAGLHLRGLFEAEWIDRVLFQLVDKPTPQEITETVQCAVAVFMAAYGPQQASPANKLGKAAPKKRAG